MALSDFLENCHCVLNDEKEDFENVCNMAKRWKNPFIGYMPLLELDLEPIYIMECTEARKFTAEYDAHVYIAPLGAYAEYSLPIFTKLLEKIYLEDELSIIHHNGHDETYGATLEEIVLLQSNDIAMKMTIQGMGEVNAVATYLYQEGHIVYLIGIADKPEIVWENVMEKYSIHANVLIDAHKGLRGWFEATPLYHHLLNAKHPELSPRYYFKGKYISHDAPDEFKL